jgi:predicted unusual protein kinase regulating ubiquinone biosynthesis (AarF/ABC1/UbiB family)
LRGSAAHVVTWSRSFRVWLGQDGAVSSALEVDGAIELPVEPYPLRAPAPQQVALRTAETMRVLRRHVVLPVLARQATRRAIGPAELAGPLRRSFRDLGGTYLKLGQLLASVPGLLGDEVADELRSLLDRSRPVPFAAVRRELERATGDGLRATFEDVDPHPLGSASMAVVHRAVLRDGREVALKILRPGIENTIACDLAVLGTILPLLAERTDGSDPALVRPLLRGLRQQLCEELDLRNEARLLDLVGTQYADAGLDRIIVPAPLRELSTRRLLVMDYIDGIALDDFEAVRDHGLDPAPIVDQLVKAFFLTALRDGFFHGDLHAGNLLLGRDGRLAVLDWGIVGRFEPGSLRQLRRVVRAALGDDAAWEEVLDWAMAQLGPMLLERFPIDEAAARGLLRAILDQVFTTPIGQLDLAALFIDPLRPVDPPAGGRTTTVAQLDPDQIDRGMALLAKQLLFYERYGRMYLSERSLLDDRDFFAELVGATTDDE